MMSFKSLSAWLLVAALAAAAGIAQAAAPATVPVGNPGNKADSTGYGAVAYEYKIGKFEVTNAEYCEFLNAVAKSDSHELYDPRMGGGGGEDGWNGITQAGSYGSYTYAVIGDRGQQPVNWVTFDSACRYANWLTNGMGKGDTEKGGYTLTGGMVKVADHAKLAAGKTVTWMVPSENEWYKAAYYDAKKPGGAGYWLYPAKSDMAPAANLNSNWPTPVGNFKDSVSPNGTYDQGGNVWEYNDTQSGDKIGLRGGSFYINDNEGYMQSGTRYDVWGAKWPNYGFRVVQLGGETSK